MWRDYKSVADKVESSRRVYGQIIQLDTQDGQPLAASVSYPLLALTTMGRSPTNTIPIDDTFASSEHANIVLRNGQWWLEDRHSRNGTMLNGIPVNQPVIITDGDIIGIGRVRLRVEIEQSA